MGYSLATSIARPAARSHASPKTHVPGSRLQERGHRFYSANMSRWISRDPLGEAGGVNLFMFCLNSPVTTYDYLGLYPGEWIVDCYKSRNKVEDLMKKARENYYKKKKDYICCWKGKEVDMDSFLDPDDGNKTSHQVLHMIMGCEMKEGGISKKCMILANLIYEGKTTWQEWIKRPDRSFEDWLKDTGYDIGAVVGGYESGGPCNVDRFRPSECVPKKEKPCGCGPEGDERK